jgi:hypothetical protein
MQFCSLCSNRFFVQTADDGLYKTCSKKCDRKLSLIRDHEKRTEASTRTSEIIPLTPDESQRIRNTIAHMVTAQLQKAHAFVMADASKLGKASASGTAATAATTASTSGTATDGTATEATATSADPDYPHAQAMNAQQVRVFTALLNKVVPDLNASFIQKSNARDTGEMTRAELEALAASGIDRTVHREAPGRDTSADPKRSHSSSHSSSSSYASHSHPPLIEDAEELPMDDLTEQVTEQVARSTEQVEAEDAIAELRRVLAASGQTFETMNGPKAGPKVGPKASNPATDDTDEDGVS